VDMTQYSGSESKWLKAADMLGANLKVIISEVKILEFEATDKQPASSKSALMFENKAKGLCLNATNNKILCKAYGADSDGWVGHEIGLSTAEYDNFSPGWVITPLDVAEPDFDDDIPF